MANREKKIDEEVQNQLILHVVDSEYVMGKANMTLATSDFESYVDLLDAVREPKLYDWMSDIRLPEFQSRILTQSALDVAQYFQTRDFVEAYLEDESDEAKANAEAAKECINRTLNQKHMHHYQKYVRAKLINHLNGNVYFRCWWEQKMREVVTGYEDAFRDEPQLDESGNPILDETGNPLTTTVSYKVPIISEEPVYDRFNYDVLDPRNVITDNKYVYDLSEKDWVIIRSEASYEDLLKDSDQMGYFNLSKLLEEAHSGGKRKVKGRSKAGGETQTSQETYNKYTRYTKDKTPLNPMFDILERHGKFWCLVTKRDPISGEPVDVEPGINDNGEPLADAQWLETIMTFAVGPNNRTLIRFQIQPYRDSEGNPYRPIFRGLCYIHPTDDGGTGDGKAMREIQIATDDTFNVSNDRVLLATLPTLIAARNSNTDNDTIRLEPLHVINEESQGDIRELKLSDNIVGALQQISMLQSSADKVMNVYPGSMGQLPGRASTTATAIADASNKSDIRTNYKSVTFENTALSTMYWMILQMTGQFAKPATGIKLMGEKVYDFNPKKDYFYKPISASIEAEANKTNKIKMWTTILGYVVQSQNPKTAELANYVLTQIFKYMGDEAVNFGKHLLDPNAPVASPGPGQQQPGNAAIPPVSNQNGVPQSTGEMAMRSLSGAG